MAELEASTPSFDGLLDSNYPKDTLITISEEDDPTSASQGDAAGAGEEQRSMNSSVSLAAHGLILWGHSSYFRAKVGGR
jgi:hypothetical protein